MPQTCRLLGSIFLTSAARGASSRKPRGGRKLCSVPMTPDPGFTPQGQPLFSCLRSQTRPCPDPLSPQGSEASPFRGPGPGPGPPCPCSPGVRPSSARSRLPVSRSCSFSRRRRKISRAASFSFLWSRGTDDARGGCGPCSWVPVGPWSSGTYEQSHRQSMSPALQVGERQAGRPRARTPGGHPSRTRDRKGQRALATRRVPHILAASSSMSAMNEGLLLAPGTPPSLRPLSRDKEEPAGTLTRPPRGCWDPRGLCVHRGGRLGAQATGTGVTGVEGLAEASLHTLPSHLDPAWTLHCSVPVLGHHMAPIHTCGHAWRGVRNEAGSRE